MSRFTNSGRFIYAVAKTPVRIQAILEDMYATGEAMPCEIKIEVVRDHRGRVKFHAITLE